MSLEERIVYMTIQSAIFLLFVFTMFLGTGVQIYIHQEAYPLLAYVGAQELPTYLKEFERRLTVPLVLPFLLASLSNIALFFIRPEVVPLVWLIVVLVLGLATAVVTGVLATPVYNRYKQLGKPDAQVVQQLVRINILRLLLSLASSAIVIYLLFLVVAR